MTNKKTSQKDNFRKILDSLPGMAYQCLYNKDWTMHYISQGCLNLTEYQPEDIIGDKTISYGDIIFTEDKEFVKKRVKEAVENNNYYNLEYRINTKNGESKWVWEQGRAIYDKDGNVKYLLGFITDITHQKKRNEKLRETKKRLELAIEGANLGIWDWDLSTGQIEINENWTSMLEYDLTEIELKVESWYNLVHEEDKGIVDEELNKHLEGKTDYYETEHRLKTKNGDYKWIRDIGKVFERDKNNNPLRAVGIHLDIDDKKTAQKKLKESEEKFRTYFENAPVGVFVIEGKGEIKEANQHACKMTGYSKEELLNKNLTDLSTRSEREIEYILKKFKNEETIEIERQFKTKSGDLFYARVNGIYIGENRFLGFVEDIDQRVKMKNRLRRQKAYFEQLFNESTEGIVLLNNKGIILKVNNHFLDIFGYTRKEARGEYIDKLITPEDKKDEGTYYTQEVMNGNDIKKESIRKTNSGENIHVSIHAFPIKLDEGQIGIYGIYNDITERKNEEAKRRYLSFHDQMTGLYNRRFFENELDRLNTSRQIPTGIIIADIDRLKKINDTYGHRSGDQYIKDAADIISEIVRQEDILARIGGDEFAVLLPETTEEEAEKIMKRIIDKIKCHNKTADHKLSISLGCAVKTNPKTDLEEILSKADAMMYRQKKDKNL
jgi:diguanylate cyclase (GGDEF)-like protein/PAS domain S-box-containing protein